MDQWIDGLLAKPLRREDCQKGDEFMEVSRFTGSPITSGVKVFAPNLFEDKNAMRILFICGVLSMLAVSCSKQVTGDTEAKRPAAQPRQTVGGPAVELSPMETAEARERKAIKAKAVDLLLAGKYDQLDELARKYRASKEAYAD